MDFLPAFGAFFLCLALTPLVRANALKKGWVAHPRKERWSKKPTAMTGGVAIYLASAVPLVYFADFGTLKPHLVIGEIHQDIPDLTAVVFVGTTLIFILGLLDDFIGIKPQTKLVGQILVASVVAFLGFRLHWVESLTVDTMVTIFWIVGLTNAFNLVDNMDGLCAGLGLIAAAYLAFLFRGVDSEAFVIALVLVGAMAGFLVYNFNPASIFMGDSGSLQIGFAMSTLSLFYAGEQAANGLSKYAVPVLLLLVPIWDTTMVTVIRLLSGRKASVGGKDHTSHRLVLIGFSEKKAVLFLYGVGAVSGFSAVFVSLNDTFTSPTVIIPLATAILLMGSYLSQIRVYPEREFCLLRGKSYTPILLDLTFKKQIILVLMDCGLIAFAYYLSYRLKFDSRTFPLYFNVFLKTLPAVIALKFLAFFTVGIYRGIWRYLSANDVFVYLKASLLATVSIFGAVTYIYRFEDFSKGIFLIDFLLTTGLLLGTRGSFRIYLDAMKRRTVSGEPVIIYGAGQGGEILLREILNNRKVRVSPVGFVDDDVLKTGKKLLGYPVLGTFKDLERLCETHGVNGILKSFNHKDSEKQNEIVAFCKNRGIYLKQFAVELTEVVEEAAEPPDQNAS